MDSRFARARMPSALRAVQTIQLDSSFSPRLRAGAHLPSLSLGMSAAAHRDVASEATRFDRFQQKTCRMRFFPAYFV